MNTDFIFNSLFKLNLDEKYSISKSKLYQIKEVNLTKSFFKINLVLNNFFITFLFAISTITVIKGWGSFVFFQMGKLWFFLAPHPHKRLNDFF